MSGHGRNKAMMTVDIAVIATNMILETMANRFALGNRMVWQLGI
ncbi:hypothetical protein [Arthrobacter ramosus]|nr:hypothetical protein [Arthrobacter ramosus]